MMAFFLLLWLLNATTEEQKKGIADYFTPTSVSQFHGRRGRRAGRPDAHPARARSGRRHDASASDRAAAATPKSPATARTKQTRPTMPSARPRKRRKSKFEKEQIEARGESFAKAENELRQAIQRLPELRQLAQNLIIDHTPEGMRIQIVDQDSYSMFPLGCARARRAHSKLMAWWRRSSSACRTRCRVTGHTDSTPLRRPQQLQQLGTVDRPRQCQPARADEGGLAPSVSPVSSARPTRSRCFADARPIRATAASASCCCAKTRSPARINLRGGHSQAARLRFHRNLPYACSNAPPLAHWRR